MRLECVVSTRASADSHILSLLPRQMIMVAGVKGQPLVFLMTDSQVGARQGQPSSSRLPTNLLINTKTPQQIVDDRFLIYINALLSSGWIPDLFPKDELEALLAGVRTEAKAQVGESDGGGAGGGINLSHSYTFT